MKRFMGKAMLIVCGLFAGGMLFAGECKNCGCDTKNVTVYRCSKCRKFFCAKCRDGNKIEEVRDPLDVLKRLDAISEALDQGGLKIICPECGNFDFLFDGRMKGNKIRLIQ